MSMTAVVSRTIARKTYLLMRRYPVNTLSQIGMMYALFSVILFGGRAFAGQLLADSLDALIVGVFLYALAYITFYRLSWNLMEEAQWGTLEQLYMSPLGFRRTMLIQTVVNLIVSIVFAGTVLALAMITAGRYLRVDLLTLVPVGLLTLASAVGLAFALSGVTLRYKRTENLLAVVQFGFVGCIVAPVETYPFLKLLPLALGSRLLGQVMSAGVRLWELPTADLVLLVGTAVGYLVLGYGGFRVAARKARKRGVLGHY